MAWPAVITQRDIDQSRIRHHVDQVGLELTTGLGDDVHGDREVWPRRRISA